MTLPSEHAQTWAIRIDIEETDGHTRARAHLRTRDNELVGHGAARCNPRDAEVPEIGEELAVARALADLAHQLFDATVGDIENSTHRRARVAER